MLEKALPGVALLLSTVLLASCATVDIAVPVVIDGSFDDWETAPHEFEDDPADAPDGFVAFGAVLIKHDRDAVYFMIEVGRTVTAQRLDGTISLLLDVDGRVDTGANEFGMDGVDVVLEFPLPNETNPGTPGAGIKLRVAGSLSEEVRLNAYSVGFVLAPVHAGDRFEMRIERRGAIGPTPPLFQSSGVSAKFVAVDLQDNLVDETEVYSCSFRATAKTARRDASGIAPLRRLVGTDLRIVTWNVSRSDFVENPDPFSRVLAALRPDVIILDEIPPELTDEMFKEFLNRTFIGNGWNFHIGPDGVSQRTAIASTFDIAPVEHFRKVEYTEQDVQQIVSLNERVGTIHSREGAADRVRAWLDSTVPASAVLVQTADGTIMVGGVDLQCCGGYKTAEDERRKIEAARVNEAVRSAVREGNVDAVVLGGDYNLVGDPEVLAIAGRDADPAGGDLVRVRAYQIDGLTDTTWANPDEPFVPGRLDYLLYSRKSLALKRGFVLDSSDLAPRWQAYYGVRAGDTAEASDHSPVVGDFQWLQHAIKEHSH